MKISPQTPMKTAALWTVELAYSRSLSRVNRQLFSTGNVIKRTLIHFTNQNHLENDENLDFETPSSGSRSVWSALDHALPPSSPPVITRYTAIGNTNLRASDHSIVESTSYKLKKLKSILDHLNRTPSDLMTTEKAWTDLISACNTYEDLAETETKVRKSDTTCLILQISKYLQSASSKNIPGFDQQKIQLLRTIGKITMYLVANTQHTDIYGAANLLKCYINCDQLYYATRVWKEILKESPNNVNLKPFQTFESAIVLVNVLIQQGTDCESLKEIHELSSKLSIDTKLDIEFLNGYLRLNEPKEALKLYKDMKIKSKSKDLKSKTKPIFGAHVCMIENSSDLNISTRILNEVMDEDEIPFYYLNPRVIINYIYNLEISNSDEQVLEVVNAVTRYISNPSYAHSLLPSLINSINEVLVKRYIACKPKLSDHTVNGILNIIEIYKSKCNDNVTSDIISLFMFHSSDLDDRIIGILQRKLFEYNLKPTALFSAGILRHYRTMDISEDDLLKEWLSIVTKLDENNHKSIPEEFITVLSECCLRNNDTEFEGPNSFRKIFFLKVWKNYFRFMNMPPDILECITIYDKKIADLIIQSPDLTNSKNLSLNLDPMVAPNFKNITAKNAENLRIMKKYANNFKNVGKYKKL